MLVVLFSFLAVISLSYFLLVFLRKKLSTEILTNTNPINSPFSFFCLFTRAVNLSTSYLAGISWICVCLCQTILSEDLRPLVSLEALQGKEVECPAAESRLLLLWSGPGKTYTDTRTPPPPSSSSSLHKFIVTMFCASALHWNTVVHHPAVPAAHHSSLLPGLHSGKRSGMCRYSKHLWSVWIYVSYNLLIMKAKVQTFL